MPRPINSTREETLRSEQNSSAMERQVRRAFHRLHGPPPYGLRAVFEHGQWWVLAGDRTYSVVDAEGPDSSLGLSFEEV